METAEIKTDKKVHAEAYEVVLKSAKLASKRSLRLLVIAVNRKSAKDKILETVSTINNQIPGAEWRVVQIRKAKNDFVLLKKNKLNNKINTLICIIGLSVR